MGVHLISFFWVSSLSMFSPDRDSLKISWTFEYFCLSVSDIVCRRISLIFTAFHITISVIYPFLVIYCIFNIWYLIWPITITNLSLSEHVLKIIVHFHSLDRRETHCCSVVFLQTIQKWSNELMNLIHHPNGYFPDLFNTWQLLFT